MPLPKLVRLTRSAPLLLGIIFGLTFAALVAAGVVLWKLKTASIEQQKASLYDIVQHEARLINSVAEYGERHALDYEDALESSRKATMYQVRSALQSELERQSSLEEVLGFRDGDEIVFSISKKLLDENETIRISWSDEHLAQPMRWALSGET
ncbi:MAG: hypothetical protein ACQKBV_13350, partial [Puniceicoccales bacterium]